MPGSIFNDIDPNATSGTQLATILNDFKDIVRTGFIGSTRPTNLSAGGMWIDDTNHPSWELNIFDGTDDNTLFTLNISTGAIILPGSQDEFEIKKVGDNSLPALLNLIKERATGGGQVLDGDTIAQINVIGEDDAGVERTTMQIETVSTDNFTSSAFGSYTSFKTTQDGANSLVERFRLTSLGRVGIGESAPSLKLEVKSSGSEGGNSAKNADDNANAGIVRAAKSRLAGSGQVLNDDNIGDFEFYSTDDSGNAFLAARIRGKALENHTAANRGTEIIIEAINATTNTLDEKLRITNDAIYLNGALLADFDTTLTLLHGGINQSLVSINSAEFTAAIVEIFAHGNDGSETRATKYVIDCLWDAVNSTWLYEVDERLMLGETLFNLVFTNAATLVIQYSNNLIQGTFVGGTIKMKVRRFAV
jgi:hypothetical protein